MRAVFRLFALFMLAAAIYHALGLVRHEGDAPLWRHALFVMIDLACAFGFWRRPVYFIWLFVLLTAQQWMSHGTAFLQAFDQAHGVAWLDGAVVAFMSTALILLLIERYRMARS